MGLIGEGVLHIPELLGQAEVTDFSGEGFLLCVYDVLHILGRGLGLHDFGHSDQDRSGYKILLHNQKSSPKGSSVKIAIPIGVKVKNSKGNQPTKAAGEEIPPNILNRMAPAKEMRVEKMSTMVSLVFHPSLVAGGCDAGEGGGGVGLAGGTIGVDTCSSFLKVEPSALLDMFPQIPII